MVWTMGLKMQFDQSPQLNCFPKSAAAAATALKPDE